MTSQSKAIQPGSVIGIVGGGQLGRMTAIAAHRLGYKAHIFCEEKNCPASEVTNLLTVAKYN
ncbi:MAG: 5-(carboxyamino)imidazole ribonucleotide synthase, partial [Pseudomonadota bacterium]|nr:5-(carboxyamino)imidazole ribonucleotide synthase [Pseudomonadota bacterium]